MSDTFLQNSKSQDTTAIYVFLRHLRMLVSNEQPEEVYIIFDFGRDVRKKAMYKDYKANRDIDLSSLAGYDLTVKLNEIESHKRQKQVIIELLKTLPVKIIIVKQIEGDSLIAFATHHFVNRGKSVTVVSNDKDFYQLLDNDKIKIFNPHKKLYIDKLNISEIFPVKNLPISSYRLYKAIRGDSSDNIKGIERFGDKTIQKMFDMIHETTQSYPKTVDELYACIPEKFSKKFADQKDRLETNFKLVDLIDTDFSPQTMGVIYQAIESMPSFSRMEFMQILIKENINTILAKVDEFMEPFNKMLPKKT
jgi:DNA polymerase-1